jgi:hypothetical protein
MQLNSVEAEPTPNSLDASNNLGMRVHAGWELFQPRESASMNWRHSSAIDMQT